MKDIIFSKRKHLKLLLLFAILLSALLIRLQGSGTLPDGMFTGSDPYHYYWLAQIISEHGWLPDRDMSRWLPLGRDLGQSLNLYPYALAYSHKTIAFFFPKVSLYHVCLYAPIVCFVFGLGVLCYFLYRTRGILFSSIFGILIATLPGAIERSSAGFSDRDSWCLMLGIIAVTTYLISLQTHTQRKRILWTIISGFTFFLGGHSWEGFGIFLSIILLVEIWRFLTSEAEEYLWFYLLWMLMFVPTLWLTSPAYRDGWGMATHVAAFMLIPPIGFFILRAFRHLLLIKIEKFRRHARTVALGLTLIGITFTLGYVFSQLNTFASTTVPLSQSQLMQSVGELRSADFNYWIYRYGSVFLIGSFGVFFIHVHLREKLGEIFAVPACLWVITVLFQDKLDILFRDSNIGHLLFLGIGVLCLSTFLYLGWTRKQPIQHENVAIAFIAWFFLWIALSRDALRYDFFIGIPLAYFTTEIVTYIAHTLTKPLKWKQTILIPTVAVFIYIVILCFPLLGGHGLRSLGTATVRKPFPADALTTNTLIWMKHNLKGNAVVAANWSYGSTLNVIAKVKTIVDQDHYIPHWITLYDRYIHGAKNERDVLTFLKTHDATHILLTRYDPPDSFLRVQLSDAFMPIYPQAIFADAAVKLWEIRYPPDIKPNPKNLTTKPSE
ncbi:hypothetical protein C6501_06945 [Candidatus Poribacteria bacterium]|nr:MAG: hypothetical protein C6501_06945 [Candidatus Poribacteria bacterium]